MAMKHEGVMQVRAAAIASAWRVAVTLAFVFVLACAARGQAPALVTPQFEAGASFSYMRGNADDSGGGFNLAGGGGSFAYNYKDRVSVVADVGAYRFSNLGGGLSSTMYTYLIGPRLPLRRNRRITPFAEILAGGGRLNASSSGINAGENSFAMAVGGGVDLAWKHRLAIRVIEGDYLLTRFAHPDGSSAQQNNVRISAGVVFRFGNRE